MKIDATLDVIPPDTAPGSSIVNAPRRSYLDSIRNDPQYEQAEQERRSARARYIDAEFERVNAALRNWRARHPLKRAVEPMTDEMLDRALEEMRRVRR